ncbi:DEAD/DEAH box helicase [Frankia sp. CNm7]|uniref:DEAD/DEAH box helicase n=1 Tax=Frankia nepalensis TaxID=1836974 RepID=A0A937RKK4_9ACTN|nr:DEAD/DEAH box helicase [Frankia nepalensis]MBL7500960.1 DEAD/DEAH box helicase [Frankia nepalensis]MBL7512412.1 DEAD/DEAH box helicase [Frankia nepalensis]MBL7516985.1 DEAD/DEAH box helicase [Frankia nepalensis]MBL7631977.1 DEAD/DEAH box helicase [Frankia nepalensis]
MDGRRVSTYGDDDDLHATLLELMAAAEKRLWIKVPWWDTSPRARQLADATVAAKERGVDVLVVCRPEASNDAILRTLRKVEITIAGVRYVHEKELLSDDTAVVHSMNFTRAEIGRNANSGLVLSEPELLDAIENGFRALLDNQAAASVGDEEWTPTATLIPDQLRPFLDRYDRLNPLQSMAVPAVLAARGHLLVVAPTSAGKTLVGEVAALRSIVQDGRPAVWLLPARALAAEVGDTVRRWKAHGIHTVELTGETNMASDTVRRAQLWVATTEKFEALYRRSSLRDFIGRIGCLVIDEVHLVGDPNRGATLESLIARLRAAEARTRIVALSATVANADELAGWLGAQLVRSAWRPTVLTSQLVPYDEPPPYARREELDRVKDAAVRVLLADLLSPAAPGSEVLGPGNGSGASSVLVFCGSKNAVRRTAALAAGFTYRPGDDDDTLVEAAFDAGVGIHFRDAPRAARALEAFRGRRIRVLVATSGLATGVNTPARAVIIRDLTLGLSPLEVSDAQQMLGRAGRAGQEPEGFGFLLVPRDEEVEWRERLATGYTAHSRVLDQLADTLLAEILIGSVPDRDSAATWFEQTFAFAQGGTPDTIGKVLDDLVLLGFVTETHDGLAVTEIGALTSRLMIDVKSAGALLTALAQAPTPSSADEAEELLLQLLATNATAFREWPINPMTYGPMVDALLKSWTPAPTSAGMPTSGSRFCLAAAELALRRPRRMNDKPPPGGSMGEFRRVVEDLPRYLTWIATLGYAGATTWASAVAADLAHRLTWWRLSPHPERGTGRLLWMLERMLDPEHRRDRMQDLWSRARAAGFDGPDGLNARPRDVDISTAQFQELRRGRAGLALSIPEGIELPVQVSTTAARLTVIANTGHQRALATTCPVPDRVTLPVPRSPAATVIAADVFLYSRDGDFAYESLVADLPADLGVADPLAEARELVVGLPELVALDTLGGLRRLLMGRRQRRRQELLPFLASDPQLRPVALALAEHSIDPTLAVLALRTNLDLLLRGVNQDALRPTATVLRSGEASPAEFALTLAALARSLGIETGLAVAGRRVVALVHVAGEWQATAQSASQSQRLEAVIPEGLPSTIRVLRAPDPAAEIPAAPRCGWIKQFAPSAEQRQR